MQQEYDVIIIGGGPAGMTAGIYAARAGMKVLMAEKGMVGGQVSLTGEIANYPGYKSVDGANLSQQMWEQASSLNVETLFSTVDKLELEGAEKRVTADGVTYSAPTVILSMGAYSRGLGVADEKRFIGKGLSYCAVCDGAFYKGKDVVVVGGGNTALHDVLYLAPLAHKVTLVHRRADFRADVATTKNFNDLVERSDSNVEQKLGFVVSGLIGEDKIEGLKLRNVDTGEEESIKADGVFVAVGRNPNTELLDGKITLDEHGYITVDQDMATNIPGVFAAGDIVRKTLRQIATAVSDGAIAGTNASLYVKRNKS